MMAQTPLSVQGNCLPYYGLITLAHDGRLLVLDAA